MRKLIHKTSLYKAGIGIALFSTFCISAFSQNVRLEKYSYGNGLKFTGDQDYSIHISGFIQPYLESKYFTDPNIDGAFNRFRLRRARIRFEGTSKATKFSWRLQFDLTGSSEGDSDVSQYLMDAWIGYNFTKKWKIRFGQKNTPTDNRELFIRSNSLQFVDRSRVTSAFATIREFGIFIDGTIKTGGSTYLRPSFAITNGDGMGVKLADIGGIKYGGRIDFLPFGLFSSMGQYHQVDVIRENTPKLVMGAAYSVNRGQSSRRGRESGSILYFDADTTLSLPNYSKFVFDFMFKYKGFCAYGEFVSTSASVPENITFRQRNDGTYANTFDVDGNRNVENYVKGRMMLGSAYNIQAGYYFKSRFSCNLRYTKLNADKHSFLNNGTFYNRPEYYTFGVSKYFTPGYAFQVQASATYVNTNNDVNDLSGQPMNGDEWLFRLITTIAF